MVPWLARPQAASSWDDGSPLSYVPGSVTMTPGLCYSAVCDISQPTTQFCYWQVSEGPMMP